MNHSQSKSDIGRGEDDFVSKKIAFLRPEHFNAGRFRTVIEGLKVLSAHAVILTCSLTKLSQLLAQISNFSDDAF